MASRGGRRQGRGRANTTPVEPESARATRAHRSWPQDIPFRPCDETMLQELLDESPPPQGLGAYERYLRFEKKCRGDRSLALRQFVGQGVFYLNAGSILTYVDSIKRWLQDLGVPFKGEEMKNFKVLRKALARRYARLKGESTTPLATSEAQQIVETLADKGQKAAAGALYMMLTLGVRADEISKCSSEDLGLTPTTLEMKVRAGKTVAGPQDVRIIKEPDGMVGFPRPKYISELFRGSVADFPFEDCTARAINRLIRLFCPFANVTTYCFRKTFAARIYKENGNDSQAVSKKLGHRNMSMAPAFYLSLSKYEDRAAPRPEEWESSSDEDEE